MKLRNSLLTKYVLIVLCALVILPLSFPILSLLLTVSLPSEESRSAGLYQNGIQLETVWHERAKRLGGASDNVIEQELTAFSREYREASVFWVDESGRTRLRLPENPAIPVVWSQSDVIQFMKQSYNADPFTIVAFIGENRNEGFMVLQVPRTLMVSRGERALSRFNEVLIGATFVIIVLFVFVSWVFFYRIRKRLLRLEQAMTTPADDGLPLPVQALNQDEVGRLEQAFNGMIGQLKESRRRETEEEELRRRLIANLSHDLRTPLTVVRGHAYSLRQEPLGERGREAVELIDQKVQYLDRLIDNLLSYTLLTSGKYTYQPVKTDIVRLVRSSCANWYPLFERERFTIDLELPDTPLYWELDPQWFERVLDNYFQNILRHAGSGKYAAVRIETGGERPVIVIEDRGPGMTGQSAGKGAGIGLSIVSLMLKEMNLRASVETGTRGTTVRISEQDKSR
jgi:signal transduction histidine kinase